LSGRRELRARGEGDGKEAETETEKRKKIRVYMDGCFDMMHFGHANALRQARMLGDELVVGVVPDHEIMANKGPPVMNTYERRRAVEAVKWVDEIIDDVPYDVSSEFLERLVTEYRIDFIVHGDDPCIGKDGQDAYLAVRKAGRFRTIKRTEGVSSTDIVGRMLLCTRNHHLDSSDGSAAADGGGGSAEPEFATKSGAMHGAGAGAGAGAGSSEGTGASANASADVSASAAVTSSSSSMSLSGDRVRSLAEGSRAGQPFTRVSTFLPTTRRLLQFSGGASAPKPGDRVVYMDGAFDMFHAGHVDTLAAARKLGDFLLVGIHDDATVNKHRGRNFPIMNLHERTLSVLSCRYVDEVIIGAPWAVTEDMLTTMNISLVVHGSHYDEAEQLKVDTAYAVAKERGIFREIPSSSTLSVAEILDRIVSNRGQYIKRQQKKTAQEANYLENQKTFVQEL